MLKSPTKRRDGQKEMLLERVIHINLTAAKYKANIVSEYLSDDNLITTIYGTMTNLDSVLKSRDITLQTKIHIKLWFFQ